MARDEQIPGIRPRPSLGRRLDIMARHSFPATSTVLLMLLCGLPFGIADQAVLLPSVTLAVVFFWSLFRPASLPPPVVFVLGLLLDLLGYLPLGCGVLTLLLVYGLAGRCIPVRRHRRLGADLGADLGAVVAADAARPGAVPGGADRRAVSGAGGPAHPGASHHRQSGTGLTR